MIKTTKISNYGSCSEVFPQSYLDKFPAADAFFKNGVHGLCVVDGSSISADGILTDETRRFNYGQIFESKKEIEIRQKSYFIMDIQYPNVTLVSDNERRTLPIGVVVFSFLTDSALWGE